MDISKVCRVADSIALGRVCVDGMDVRETSNPFDALDVPEDKTSQNDSKHRIILADSSSARAFLTYPSSKKRAFLSRLSDSDRRRFLKIVHDLKEKQQRIADSEVEPEVEDQQDNAYDDIDLDVFETLVEDALGSLSEDDIRLMQNFAKSKNLPAELTALADKIAAGDYNPDSDAQIVQDALPYLGENGTQISDMMNRVFGVDKDTNSRIDITAEESAPDEELPVQDSLVEIPKPENQEESSDEKAPEEVVGETEDNIYVDDENLESADNVDIKDSVNKIKDLMKIFASKCTDSSSTEHYISMISRKFNKLSSSMVKLAVYDCLVNRLYDKHAIADSSKVSDGFVDELADDIASTVDQSVGEISLVDVLSEALTDFANGDSSKLEKFCSANSLGAVVELLNPDEQVESEDQNFEEVIGDGETEEEPTDETSEEPTDETSDEAPLDNAFSDFNTDEFNPNEFADSLKLGKLVLAGKLTEKIRDCVAGAIPAITLISVPEDETCTVEPFDTTVQTVNVPLTRDEYCNLMANNNDVERATQQICPFTCEDGVQAEQNGPYITVKKGCCATNLIPVSESVEEVIDSIKDGVDVAKKLSEKCVRVRDAKKVAKMLGRLDFLDNRYYKKHLSDTEFVKD